MSKLSLVKMLTTAATKKLLPETSALRKWLMGELTALHPTIANIDPGNLKTFMLNAEQKVTSLLGKAAKGENLADVSGQINKYLTDFGPTIAGVQIKPKSAKAVARFALASTEAPKLTALKEALLNPDPENLRKSIQGLMTPEVTATLDKVTRRRLTEVLREGSLEGERSFAGLTKMVSDAKAAGMPQKPLLSFTMGAFQQQIGYDVGTYSPKAWAASPVMKLFKKDALAMQGGAVSQMNQPKPGLGRRALETGDKLYNRKWRDMSGVTKTALVGGGFTAGPDLLAAPGILSGATGRKAALQNEMLRAQTVDQVPTVAELLLGQTMQETLTQRAGRLGTAIPQNTYVPAPQPARGVIKIGGQAPQAAGGQQDIASLLLGGMGSETGGGY